MVSRRTKAKEAKELGRRLRQLRTQTGRSAREVAAACSMPEGALGAYERGERTLPAARLGCLCAYYGVPVGEVLGAAPEAGGGPSSAPAGPSSEHHLRVPFDFDGLTRVKSSKAKAAAAAVNAIRERRSTVRPSDRVFLVRRDDLLVIAAAVGMSSPALVEMLRAEGALRKPKGRPAKSAARRS